ncbi:DNA cytosine methyltransferase [Candidatus Poriferisodalis sp.]|uniref:DNA cytosine methyltransferase n=1 Tax=Candidatus Poriferisodalis sp. TaxID=3101277 RepID=UPI003B012414
MTLLQNVDSPMARRGSSPGCDSRQMRLFPTAVQEMGPRAAEFFAGMGLVRAGLERCGVRTVFANDIDETKAALYRANWGDESLVVGDIRDICGEQIPDIEVATASFPCVDLSLAGARAGLAGEHSGLIHHFVRILAEMGDRAPRAVLVENVPGFLTANGGEDFRTVVELLGDLEYQVSDATVDAAAFLPQSRPRVFLLAAKGTPAIAVEPPPRRSDTRLADVADDDGEWWSGEKRDAFFDSLSDLQQARLRCYRESATVSWRGAYRRTRGGRAVWEIRGDEIAGALRTTRGGSSRQAIVRAGQGAADVRWMSPGEYARLQGAGDLDYGAVTERQAMFALGDAVCVPVVEWLGHHWLARVLA